MLAPNIDKPRSHAPGLDMPPIEAMAQIAADTYGVETSEVLGRRKFKRIIIVRQVVMFLATARWGLPAAHVGRRMQRDHSTVLSARAKIARLMNRDPNVAVVVNQIANRFETWEAELRAVEARKQAERAERRRRAVYVDPRIAKRVEVSPTVRWLRSKGWSVKSIARHTGLEEIDVAEMVGAPWDGCEWWIPSTREGVQLKPGNRRLQ